MKIPNNLIPKIALPDLKSVISIIGKHSTLVKIAILGLIYFFIRIGFQGSIEFGYDPGRIALAMAQIIDKSDYINIPYHILINIIDGPVSWGPAVFYVLLPFFLITKDALLVTNMLIVFQFTGIVALYYAVELLYNKRVAFFASLFAVVFPWHVYFSRMIYQPSMLLWSVPIVILVTLLVIKKGKQKLLLLLPFLWVMMIQFHFIGLVVLGLSFGYIVFHYKSIVWRYFRFGLLIAIIAVLPIILYDVGHEGSFTKRLLKGNVRPPETEANPMEVVRLSVDYSQKYIFLTDVDNHLGYASKDFFKSLPLPYKIFQPVYVVLVLASILFFIAKIFWRPRRDDVFVFLWFISVTVILVVFNYRNSKSMMVAQRYFIPMFFTIGIMIGYMIDKSLEKVMKLIPKSWQRLVHEKMKLGTDNILAIAGYAASAVAAIAFLGFMMAYHSLIIDYTYHEGGWNGWLAHDSGPPYLSTYEALKYVYDDSKKAGFDRVILNHDWNVIGKSNAYDFAKYIWTYTFKQPVDDLPGSPIYYMVLGPEPPGKFGPGEVKRFGAVRVGRDKGSITGSDSSLEVTGITQPFALVSVGSSKCLDVENANTKAGTPLIQFDYLANANQRFRLVGSDETGYYYIVSVTSGRYLEVQDGIYVRIDDYKTLPGQKWKIEQTDKNVRIRSRLNNMALAVEKGSKDNLAKIVVEPESKSDMQLWRVTYF